MNIREYKNKPEIVIKTTGGYGAKVFVDGNELYGVKGYSFTHKAGELPQLTLDMKATNVTIETDVLPALPHPYDSFYVSKQMLEKEGDKPCTYSQCQENHGTN